MVECLQNKQTMIILPDYLDGELFHLPPPHALPVPFLGRTLPFRTGAFRLAQWLDVPTIPFFVVPDGEKFVLKLSPPLTLSQDKSIEGLRANVAAYATLLEAHIRQYPGLWWQWRQERLLELMGEKK
jgi:lauroyl/myristoyl acyltransferase